MIPGAGRRWPLLLLVVALIVSAGSAQIFTADAGVRSPELPSVRELVVMRGYRDATELRAVSELTWSPSTRFETKLEVPFVGRDLEIPAASGAGFDGSYFALGDTVLRGKLALLRDDDVMRSNRVALLAAVYAPTGEHDRTLGGVRLPRRVQAGLGGVAGSLGVAGTIVRDRHRASLSAEWLHGAAHDGFEPGDELAVDAAWWYRLSPGVFDPALPATEYRLVTELRSVHRFADHEGGVRAPDDGLRSEMVLGLQANTSNQRLRFEIGAVVPVFEDTPGPLGRFRAGGVVALTLYF